MGRARFDMLAGAAAVLAVVVAVGYVSIMRQQSDRPVAWFLGSLALGATLAGYGAWTEAVHRRAALLVASVLLMGMGVLAILSIGLPVLVAGLLCGVAAGRSGAAAAT